MTENDDGVSLKSTAHPTSWWWTIKYWFLFRRLSKKSIVTIEIDPAKIRNDGLKILSRARKIKPGRTG